MTELAKLIASGVAAFGDLRRELSEGAQALLAIACLALILALIWVVILASPAVSRVHPALIYVPSAALTTLAILVVGGAILQQMVDNRRTLVQQTVDNRKVLNRIRVQLGSTPPIPPQLRGCHPIGSVATAVDGMSPAASCLRATRPPTPLPSVGRRR